MRCVRKDPASPSPPGPTPPSVPPPLSLPPRASPLLGYRTGIQRNTESPATPCTLSLSKGARHRSDAIRRIPAKAGIQTSSRASSGQAASAQSLRINRAAEALSQFAARGRELARLLDPETPVPGVTTGPLRPEIAAIAVPSTIDGRNMSGADFELTAGWGHFGSGQAVMPGQGRVIQRPYMPAERQAPSHAAPPSVIPAQAGIQGGAGAVAQPRDVIPAKSLPRTRYGAGIQKPPDSPDPTPPQLVIPAKAGIQSRPDANEEPAESRVHPATTEAALGATTRDIHLNDRAYWRNVPAAVWDYKLGGYQVLKKWLSYRERAILRRPLTPNEIHHFTTTARRIAAILLLTTQSTAR